MSRFTAGDRLTGESVENVDKYAAPFAYSGGFGDGAKCVGYPTALADHATQVILVDGDLVDKVPVFFELLHLNCVAVLYQ
jgi:hypothetical protein